MKMLEYYEEMAKNALNPRHRKYAKEMIKKINGNKPKFAHHIPGYRLKYYCEINRKQYGKLSEIAIDLNLSMGMLWNMLNGEETNLIGIRKI